VVLLAPTARGQQQAIPGTSYYAAVELLYRGDYARAERAFTGELRGAVKTVQARWIDSICFHAMLGETYYQRGQHRLALVQFNQACELALAYPNWLMRVEFRQAPRAETNLARRIAPWGRSQRGATLGTLPETMLIGQGQVNNNQQVQQGGVVQQAQFWRVNVVEVIRCTALSIRRRNEILGPLGPHDRLSKDLVTTYSRADLAPRNHWSGSWIELLLGLAQAGVGESQQSLAHLSRGVVIDGRYDYPLTGAALLAQAEVALAAGNAQAAGGLLLEAGYAAFAFRDYDVLGEALRRGHEVHVALGGEGPYPPLAAAAAWARVDNVPHLAAAIHIDAAEAYALAGDSRRAMAELANISPRAREVLAGRLGPKRNFVEAIALYQSGKGDVAGAPLGAAIEGARVQSIRNLQIDLANERYDSGEISPRVAVDLYVGLLADPVPGDWALDPLNTLAHLKSNHEEAFGRWFLAALSRKEVMPAVEISDQAKRRRFWIAQPLGGRLLTLRLMLDGPVNQLPQATRLERQALLGKLPGYDALSKQSRQLASEIAGEPLVAEGRVSQQQLDRFKQWQAVASDQEALLRPVALSRSSTTLVFPPTLDKAAIQQRLEPGQALLVFHQVGGAMYGLLISTEAYHPWRLPDAADLDGAVATALQSMGNFAQNRTLEIGEVGSAAWVDQVLPLANAIFAESRLDVSQTTELIVVPDGVLWHLPLEAMPIASLEGRPLGEMVPVRYAPTVGLALGYQLPTRPIKTTAVAVPSNLGDDAQLAATVDRLVESAPSSVVLPQPSLVPSPLLASAADNVISLVETRLDGESPYSLLPLPIDRTTDIGTLGRWMALPVEGPERVILANLSTAAESGLKQPRRTSRSRTAEPAAGQELFQATCGLMASGTQTILLTRWRTGGQTHRELLGEFASEVTHMPAGQAWRRSVLLAQSQPLDAESEPRIKRPDARSEMPQPKHPFLWAGYLLVDTGRQIGEATEPEAEP
jgi:hypothetical protein